jgi:hypothetical protein
MVETKYNIINRAQLYTVAKNQINAIEGNSLVLNEYLFQLYSSVHIVVTLLNICFEW